MKRKSPTNVICICYSIFASNQDLNLHIESIHKQKPFKCNICGCSFTRKVSLKKNIQARQFMKALNHLNASFALLAFHDLCDNSKYKMEQET